MKSILWLIGISLVVCKDNATSPDGDKCFDKPGMCNQYTPCCNTGGWCGLGFSYCGQTCVESGNLKGTKCLPPPTCQDKDYVFSDDRIIHEDDYAKSGDFLKYDFRVRGDYEIQGDEIVLKMSKENSGASIQSTRYINYGRISADIKTARGQGVVSSFITMSEIKDEIDFEWLGKSLTEFQSNWFRKGIIPEWPATNGQVHPQANSFNEFHNYVIDWDENRIQWIIDGNIVRELKRNGDDYPSTPSLFSFGIWDGGSGAEGTRMWAGGYVDWKSPDMINPGYYSVRVKNVRVECIGAPTSKDSDFVVDKKFGLILKKEQDKYRALAGNGHGLVPYLPLLIFSLILIL